MASPDPPRVMIVEDDIHLLSALTFALEAEGFAVAPFARGDEALQAPFRADCIVIDFKLPDRDGLTLIEALRCRGVSCPAILITSNPDERCRRRATAAQVRIVEKPLLGPDLGRQIGLAIGRA